MTVDRSDRLCVLGAGLIGGSVMRAAAAAGYDVWGLDRSVAEVALARAEGFAVTNDLAAALRRAAAVDALLVIAVPMPAVDEVVEGIARWAPDCALTDVVSVKGAIRSVVLRHGLEERFVGGHPMAGTAQSGWTGSDAGLFQEAAWAVTVDPGTDPDVWRRVVRLALSCGAVAVPVSSRDHDHAVARVSHVPHVLAEALAVVGAGGGELALGLAAGSFRDGTRVAGTAPELVRAFCEPNATALAAVLDETIAVLRAARENVGRESLEDLANEGHQARKAFETAKRWEIRDITPGDTGWLSRLREAGLAGGVLRQLPGEAG